MACEHKFINDLQLQYVDWEVKTLFIGTFNPGWNECVNNNASWFYGRTQRNEFWHILPYIHEQKSLMDGNRESWIKFCKKNSIAITDILLKLNDADSANNEHRKIICNLKDDSLENFKVTINDIAAILENHKSIRQICITRQTLPLFWENCFQNMIKFIKDNPLRNIQVLFLRSPSRGARNGVKGEFYKFIANRWIEQGYKIDPLSFMKSTMKYTKVYY